MKSIGLALAATLASTLATGQEVGRVLSRTPVIQQFSVPQQVCSQEPYAVPAENRGGGAAIGAIAGGAIGNAIGHGGGRAAATVLGIVGGAVIGDRLEGSATHQRQQVPHCTIAYRIENRITHYDVVYAYAGRTYAAQLPHDPGPTVRLQVTPVGATPPPPPLSPAPPLYGGLVITQSEGHAMPAQTFRAAVPVFITVPIFTYGGHARSYRAPHAQGHAHPRRHAPRWH